MTDIEEMENNNLIFEIEQELELINKETENLEQDFRSFKTIHEELERLRSENNSLQEKINQVEINHDNFVQQLQKIIKQRDDALNYLLTEVKKLKVKISSIRD